MWKNLSFIKSKKDLDFQRLDIIIEDINIPVIVNGGINSRKEIK